MALAPVQNVPAHARAPAPAPGHSFDEHGPIDDDMGFDSGPVVIHIYDDDDDGLPMDLLL